MSVSGWLRSCRSGAPALIAYLCLSLLFCSNFFTWSDLWTHAIVDGDPALNAWALQWVTHALLTAPGDLFGGNVFYPFPYAISLSEHMFTLALINVPLHLLSVNPWLGYNLLIFLAYFLSGVGGFLLWDRITGNRWVAFWSGLYWGFLFYRVHHIGHLQLLSYQFIPFTIWALLGFWSRPRLKSALSVVFFFVLQAWCSWYLAVILGVIAAVVGLARHPRTRDLRLQKRFFEWYLAMALLIGVLLGPFIWATARVMPLSTLSTRVIDTRRLSNQIHVADYLTPPRATWIGRLLPNNPYWIWEENTLYIGYIPLLLAILALALFFTGQHRKDMLNWLLVGISLVVVGFVLAMGYTSSSLGMRLPLAYLADLFPPLGAIRAPQRFSLVLYFGVLILSSLGLERILKRLKNRWSQAAVTVVCSVLFLAEVYPVQLPLNPRTRFQFSSIDKALLKGQTGSDRKPTVLHLPIHYFLQTYAVSEAKYMVGSTLHWARTVNGFSGAEPLGFRERMERLNQLPAPAAVEELRKLNLDFLALHPDTAQEQKTQVLEYFGSIPTVSIQDLGEGSFLIDLRRWKE